MSDQIKLINGGIDIDEDEEDYSGSATSGIKFNSSVRSPEVTYGYDEDTNEDDVERISETNTSTKHTGQGKGSSVVRKRFITAALSMSFLCLGFTYSILGPTLLALSDQVGGASVGSMGSVFAARSFGYLLGSIGGGKAIDFFKNPRWLLVMIMSIVMVGSIAVPYCTSIEVLGLVVMLHGIGMGTLDTCGNVLAIRTWQDGVGPHLQTIHFAFAVGAFTAPMVARQMLVQNEEEAGGRFCDLTDYLDVNTTRAPEIEPQYQDNVISWTWWTGSVASGITSIVWIGLSWVEIDMEPPDETTSSDAGVIGLQGIKLHRKQIIGSVMGFLCVYVGAEVAYGGLAYTYVVEACVLDVAAAADLTASYWGTFALGRLFAIPLSTIVKPSVLLMGSLMVATLAILVEQAFIGQVWAVWSGTFFYGLGLAASFPTVFTILSEQIDVTGKIATLTVVASAFGEMTVPWIVAEIMDTTSPSAFVAGLTTFTLLSDLMFVWISYITKCRRELHWKEMSRRAIDAQDEDDTSMDIDLSSASNIDIAMRSRSKAGDDSNFTIQ